MFSLRSLSLDSINATDATYEQIARRFPSLHKLYVDGIEGVFIDGTFIDGEAYPTDMGLSSIRKLPCLEHLEIRCGQGLSFGGAAIFSDSPTLRELCLFANRDADGLAQLHDCPALEKLRISKYSRSLTPRGELPYSGTTHRASQSKPRTIAMERLPKLRDLTLDCADVSWRDDTSVIEELSLGDSSTPPEGDLHNRYGCPSRSGSTLFPVPSCRFR